MPLSEFRLQRRVQFHETDAAGIVHFSWFFRYLEEAEHALWRATGHSIHQPGSDIGWPRVAASFEFRRSLRFEDEFDVRIRIAEMTKRSIRYAGAIIQGEKTLATGELTIACVRRVPGEPMKSIDIPPEIAGRFEIYRAEGERLRATD